MPRNNTLSTYRTTWVDNGDQGNVTYINTEIVRWDDDQVTLNSGGWETVTTKRKMNQAARQFAKRFSVFQHDFVWYVEDREGNVQKFYDGMTVAA